MKTTTRTALRRIAIALPLPAFIAGLLVYFMWQEKSAPPAAEHSSEPAKQPAAEARDSAVAATNSPAVSAGATVPGVPTQTRKSLVKLTGHKGGALLTLKPALRTENMDAGREFEVAMPDLAAFAPGDVIEVAMPDGRTLPAKVNISREDLPTTWVLAAGFGNDSGGLTLRQDKARRAMFGRIFRVDEPIAYTVATGADGKVWATERWRDQLLPVCAPPGDDGAAPAPGGPEGAPPPPFDSLPGATAVLYVDFDGEANTSYPDWPASNPGGVSFACGDPGFTEAQMTDMLTIIAEDYAPFNISVTTSQTRYDNAVGKRMRCIVTSNNAGTARTDGGFDSAGAAWGGSFLPGAMRGSVVVASDCPCWVTTPGYPILTTNRHRIMADAVAHEFGHTLGLAHDGTASLGYYTGHGTSPNDWAPIMGNYRGATDNGLTVVQWSKGQYSGANNNQDDVAVISSTIVTATGASSGYLADESTGYVSAQPITLDGSKVGVISSDADSDYFSFATGGPGAVNITVTSAVGTTTQARNLDVGLELLTSVGVPITSSEPTDSMDATITANVPTGQYILRVYGTGHLTASTGWTSYGSLGAYAISGTLPPPPDTTPPTVAITDPNVPVVTSLTSISGEVSDGAAANASGVASVFVRIQHGVQYWDGSAWGNSVVNVPVTPSAGTWTFTNLPTGFDARSGLHTVSVYASDLAGNSGSASPVSTTFTVDRSPPTVAIHQPAFGTVLTSRAPLTFSGTAFDDVAVTGLQLFVRRDSDSFWWNGSGWQATPSGAAIASDFNPGAQGWSATGPLPLAGDHMSNGNYTFVALVNDAIRPAVQVERTITISDTQAPVGVVVFPFAGGTFITPTNIVFAGTMEDNFYITNFGIYLQRVSDGYWWDGTGWLPGTVGIDHDYFVRNDGTWAATEPLPTPGLNMPNGSYRFIVAADDRAGLHGQSESVVTVSYTTPAILGASHRDFSNTNVAANATIGTFGWRYGYYDTAGTTGNFSVEGIVPTNPVFGEGPAPGWQGSQGFGTPAHFLQMLHTGYSGNNTVVRRYRVNPAGAENNGEPPFSGPVRIVGRFYDLDSGATDGFVNIGSNPFVPATRIGPAGFARANGPGWRMEGNQLTFDFTAVVGPGATIDFGVTPANDGAGSDMTGFVGWIVQSETPVPTNIVANAYHSANVILPNTAETRGDAYALVTDGRIGAANGDCFDTYPAPGHPNQFAGLLYLENNDPTRATRFNSVRVDMGTLFVDGGEFAATPRLFILRHNSDPNTSDPTTDERYTELSVTPTTGTNTAGRPYYVFDLAGAGLGTVARTGYGFAVVGPGSGSVHHISVAEITADAERSMSSDVLVAQPKFWEYEGHRYALTFARGTWQDCENEAVARGGHLVAIGSAQENEWLVNTFGDEQFYIGLTRPDGATPYAWSNGDALTFTQWIPGQPDGPIHHWVTINVLNDFGRWGNTAIGGFPETANYRGIIELPTTGTSEAGFRLTVPGRSTVFGAGHNPAQTFPAPAAATPASGSLPPAHVRLPASGGGRKIVFNSVTGSIHTNSDAITPDGGRQPGNPRLCDISPVSPANGISGYRNLDNIPAMLGVFVTDSQPAGAPPATLDFSSAALGENFASIAPQLGQVFFIGDGHTGVGAQQEFIVPAGATRLYLGMPDAYEGNNTLIYTGVPNGYSDNTGSFVAKFSVVPHTNADPVAQDDQFSVLNIPSGQSFPLDVRANDTDADNHPLTITSVTAAAHGTVSITGGGTGVSYAPAVGFFGADTFTYTISDGNGGGANATVTVGVQRDFAAWAAAEGLTGGNNGTNDDPDGDGISNLFEFFHGIDPEAGATAADRAALPVLGTSPGPGTPTFLTYTYRRSLAASGITVTYELASTLAPADWTPTAPSETTILSTDVAGGTQVIRVKFPLPVGTTAKFIKLKLTP